MAASPVTGDRPNLAGYRRSSSQFNTLPQRSLSFHERVGLAEDDAAANVLYMHPNVRIYSFKPPTDALKNLDRTKKTLPDADYPIDAIEVLPWRARTETLSAKGRMIIEKVQGSAHFLKAGDLIYTIMRNSQCWCVDGESMFVMRIGQLRYQRIEMPAIESADKQKVAEFKEVVSKILKFEKTPCPFVRGFQVNLPEDAITPRRRGPWKRKESLTPVTPDDEIKFSKKAKPGRTMSMRGMPPSSFPSGSMSQIDLERPRTASTPTPGRFSFPDVRIESPTNYTSGEDHAESENPDSESEKPESSQHSEHESDREVSSVPILSSPLRSVETVSPAKDTPDQDRSLESAFAARRAERQRANTTRAYSQGFSRFETRTSGDTLPNKGNRSSPRPHVQEDPSPLAMATELVSARSQTRSETSHEPRPTLPDTQPNLDAESTGYDTDDPLWKALLEDVRKDTSKISDPKKSAQQHEEVRPDASGEMEQDPTNQDAAVVESSKVYRDKQLLQNQLSTKSRRLPESEDFSTESEGSLSSQSAEQEAYPDRELRSVSSVKNDIEPRLASISEFPSDDSALLERTRTNDDVESTASFDSFHTLLSDDDSGYETRPAPQYLNIRPFTHRRELSEMTVIPELAQQVAEAEARLSIFDDTNPSSRQPQSQPQPQPEETSSPNMSISDLRPPGSFETSSELRYRLSHRRSHSSLPSSSILHAPSSNDTSNSPHTTIFLQKAATLAVIKPVEVAVFIFRILARIAQGATMNDLVSGDLWKAGSGRPDMRRTASGTFESNIKQKGGSEMGDDGDRDSEAEDDYGYGVAVRGRKRSVKDVSRKGSGDSVD